MSINKKVLISIVLSIPVVLGYLSLQENFFIFLGLFIIASGVCLYYAYATLKPFLAVLLVPIGSYLGYLFQVFKDAPVPFSLFQIFLLLAFVVFFFHKIITKDFQLKLTTFEPEFFLFLTLIYLSLIYSPNRGDGLLYATRFFVLILMLYLFINSIYRIKQISWIIYIIIIISIVLGILSIKEGLFNTEAALWNYFTMGQKLASRATVIQRDPNIFASHFFLPLLFSASMVMMKGQKFRYRVLGFVIFSIFFLSIISTFSRSAWVSIFISLLFLTLLLRQYKMIFYLILVGLAAFIFIPNFQIIFLNVVRRFVGIFAGNIDYSSKVRILLGTGAIEMFLNSCLLGVGFRGFPIVFPRFVSTQKTFGIVEPHNVFYTVLAELGLLGFLLFLWIIFKMGLISYQNYRISNTQFEKIISSTLLATFISYLIFYQFYVDGLVDNNFWMVVGLNISLSYILGTKKLLPRL